MVCAVSSRDKHGLLEVKLLVRFMQCQLKGKARLNRRDQLALGFPISQCLRTAPWHHGRHHGIMDGTMASCRSCRQQSCAPEHLLPQRGGVAMQDELVARVLGVLQQLQVVTHELMQVLHMVTWPHRVGTPPASHSEPQRVHASAPGVGINKCKGQEAAHHHF